MIADLKTKFFIHNMKQKVMQFCKDCYICAISKSKNMRQLLQGLTEKLEYPKQILLFNVFGGLPKKRKREQMGLLIHLLYHMMMLAMM